MAPNFVRALIGFLTLIAMAVSVMAQTADNSSQGVLEAIKPALEQAEKSGATVIVIAPADDKDASAGVAGVTSFPDQLMQAKVRFGEVLQGHQQAWGHMRETLAQASPDGGGNWLLFAVIAGIIGVVAGHFLTKPIANWLRDTFAPRVRDLPETRAQKIGYLLFRGFMFVILATISATIGTVIVVLYAGDHVPTRATGLAVVWTYALLRYARAIYINFLVPNVPNYRVINMDDKAAAGLYQMLMIGTTVSIGILGLCLWMDRLGLDENTHKLSLIFGALSATILLSAISLVYRQEIAQAVLGFGEAADKPVWLRTLAKTWHVLLIVYVAFAWLVTMVRLLLDLPNPMGLVGAPLAALTIGLTVYGIALVAIDAYFDRAQTDAKAQPTEAEYAASNVIDGEFEVSGESDGTEQQAPDEVVDIVPAPTRTLGYVFKGLAEHGAALMVSIVGFFYVAGVWGVDFADQQSWVAGLLDIAIVIFAAYIAYRAVELWIDAKRAAEGDIESDEPGGDPGGHGASRLVTLLPILRNFLLITIVVIAGMIALAELGINIAPLFAGAGVVGLAIGFGAQTLVRDIFSGAFFLMDDAFRKGEYIDIGSAKGTVEKISIRSFQLRHHRGALNTVPFGEIRQLTNFSRDWVMMKLPLRVTYDTDPEKVRKLVKKLGVELADDPEFGEKFLQPLKSQGVYQMDDSAMIVRLKFMTRPGDQFAIRTKVYTRIRELFEQEGIKFAHREVTVRVNEGGDGVSREEHLKAATGAALAAMPDQKP